MGTSQERNHGDFNWEKKAKEGSALQEPEEGSLREGRRTEWEGGGLGGQGAKRLSDHRTKQLKKSASGPAEWRGG